MTAVDTLRRAATLMRQRAQAATAGPWRSFVSESKALHPDRGVETTYRDWSIYTDRFSDPSNAEHIASWHPAVALAVADWLDSEAAGASLLLAVEGVAIAIGGGARVSHSTLPVALTVARAYLGEAQ